MLLAQLRRTLGQASKGLTEYDSSGPTRRHLETPQALERRTQEGKLGDPSDKARWPSKPRGHYTLLPYRINTEDA